MPSSSQRAPLSEQEIRNHTVGELKPLSNKILISNYDPRWPELFRQQVEKIQQALGPRALRIEHVGSTSVPELAAKPIIDIVLIVADSAEEKAYVPELESIGYTLRIREPDWHQHRMLKRQDPETNLHVFSTGCPEVDRMLMFRDWLRTNSADRDLYARTKMSLAQQDWKYVQNYADAKTAVIEEITQRARKSSALHWPEP